MSETAWAVALWLFVINLGVAFGAGVYEQRIVVPRWAGPPGAVWNAEAARQDDTGRRFWAFVTTVPLTLLTVINLVAAGQEAGALHTWWLTAGLVAAADRVLTFAYFIPVMVRLMASPGASAAAVAATRWKALNYVRLAILLLAWVAALQAFGLSYRMAE